MLEQLTARGVRAARRSQWRRQRLCVGADPSAGGETVEEPSGIGSGEGHFLHILGYIVTQNL